MLHNRNCICGNKFKEDDDFIDDFIYYTCDCGNIVITEEYEQIIVAYQLFFVENNKNVSNHFSLHSDKKYNYTVAKFGNEIIQVDYWYQLDFEKIKINEIKNIITKIHSLKEFV